LFYVIYPLFIKYPIFFILVFLTIILFIFRKKLFRGKHEVNRLPFKERMKAFLIYWFVYSLAIGILEIFYFSLTPLTYFKIHNLYLYYLFIGVILTIFAKAGSFIINRKWVWNKQTFIWIIIHGIIIYLLTFGEFILFSLIPSLNPIISIITSKIVFINMRFSNIVLQSIILGLMIKILSKFAWNSMNKNY